MARPPGSRPRVARTVGHGQPDRAGVELARRRARGSDVEAVDAAGATAADPTVRVVARAAGRRGEVAHEARGGGLNAAAGPAAWIAWRTSARRTQRSTTAREDGSRGIRCPRGRVIAARGWATRGAKRRLGTSAGLEAAEREQHPAASAASAATATTPRPTAPPAGTEHDPRTMTSDERQPFATAIARCARRAISPSCQAWPRKTGIAQTWIRNTGTASMYSSPPTRRMPGPARSRSTTRSAAIRMTPRSWSAGRRSRASSSAPATESSGQRNRENQRRQAEEQLEDAERRAEDARLRRS